MVKPELKDRYASIYFPSEEAKHRWEKLAKAAGLTLSKYIYQRLEQAIKEEAENQPRSDLAKENIELKEKNGKLITDLKRKDLLLEKYENEIYKLRYSGFSPKDLDGNRLHSKELIEILKRGHTLQGHEILRDLGIDPKDSEAMRLLSNQLEALRGYGLVVETAHGWKWKA